MPLSYEQYPGDGTTNQFPVAFPYINKDDVTVSLDGTPTAFTWVTDSQVSLVTAPALGVIVEVGRNTPKAAPQVDFTDGSVLGEAQLDASVRQLLFGVQEAFDRADLSVRLDSDGTMNAKGKRIKNVADPVNPQDAATKSWVESTTASSAALAAQKAAEAAASAASVGGVLAATTVEKQAAQTAAQNSSGSASTAATAATNAATAKAQAEAALATLQGQFTSFTPTGVGYSSDLHDIIRRFGVTPYDYGAVDNGTTDDAPAWAAACAALGNGGGGILWVPPSKVGSWNLASAINILKSGVNIMALGKRVYIGDPRTASGDLFIFGDATHSVYGCGMKGFLIQQRAGAQRNGGIFIRAIKANESDFEDITIDHCFQAVEVQDFNNLRFRRCNFIQQHQVGGRLFRAYSHQTAGRSDQLTFHDVTLQANNTGANCLEISGNIHTGQFFNTYLLGGNRNLLVTQEENWGGTGFPSFLTFWNLQTDRSIDHAICILAGFNIHFVQPDIANTSYQGSIGDLFPQGGNDGAAFFVNGPTTGNKPDRITIRGGRVGNCRLSNVALAYCRRFRALGVEFMDGNKSSNYGTGRNPIISIGPDTGYNVIRGCMLDGESRANYAVAIDANSGINAICENDIYQRSGMTADWVDNTAAGKFLNNNLW